MNWKKHIKVKYLLSEAEDYDSVKKNMGLVAEVLSKHWEFYTIVDKLKNIPRGDDTFSYLDYANKYLDEMYNIADENRVWIE